MVDIKGLNRAAVLAALYNRAQPQGMGFMKYDPKPMTEEEAEEILKRLLRFDYLKGRVLKVDLIEDSFDPRLYDRDNGEGAAEEVVRLLRETGSVNPPATQLEHAAHARAMAHEAKDRLGEKTTLGKLPGGMPHLHLGLDDVADKLEPRLDQALEE